MLFVGRTKTERTCEFAVRAAHWGDIFCMDLYTFIHMSQPCDAYNSVSQVVGSRRNASFFELTHSVSKYRHVSVSRWNVLSKSAVYIARTRATSGPYAHRYIHLLPTKMAP